MRYRIPAWIEFDADDEEEAHDIAHEIGQAGYLSFDTTWHPNSPLEGCDVEAAFVGGDHGLQPVPQQGS